ncbi:MAG: MFS transporter [Alphaproteobacteria bacterium]|nr:MFS transporter [Alphaproteobacteria bacterium]
MFNRALNLFYFSAFLKSQMFLLPVLFLFYQENGLSMADYFLFQGIIVLVNVMLQIPAGFVGDKIPRKYILLISYTLFLGRIFCWFFWKGMGIVLIGELLYALSKALFDTVESPILYDILSQEQKRNKMVRAYSKLNFALSLGTGIAALCGAWLYETVGLKVLLGGEFILITIAILMATQLPFILPEKCQGIYKESLGNMIKNSISILKEPNNNSCILYSGLLVAFSHFFFWSFQPMMKLAVVPIALFGVVMFVNNMMRSFGSLLTDTLLKYIRLKVLGRIVFIMNTAGLLCGFVFQKGIIAHWEICLVFVFYLCVCITLQLMFTIAQISRLQQVSEPHLRTQTAAVNMLIARLCTAILLIIPKYLTSLFSLMTLYLVYGLLFVWLGWFLYRRVSRNLA